jgi:hypothetical protein
MEPPSAAQIHELEVTRLCHLTPSQNLVHIASDNGILATQVLASDTSASFTAQDKNRLDGRPEHISCSIQYPNGYYYRSKRNPIGEAANFPDWVVLGIDPACMLRPETLFCQGNAAGGSGAFLAEGAGGLASIYADKVEDSVGRTFWRGPEHLKSCPTNLQAEVMIFRHIPLTEITSVFVADESQARREYARLKMIGVDPSRFRYVIAPEFFDVDQLSANIRTGLAPVEVEWNPPR